MRKCLCGKTEGRSESGITLLSTDRPTRDTSVVINLQQPLVTRWLMSTICKCHGSSLVFLTHSGKCSLTYHERDAECEVPWGANEVSHFAVHPAHDVHVDRAALQTSSRELEMHIYSAPNADMVWIFLPAEPCWAGGQTPGLALCLWTSWLRMCSGRQPRTLPRCCSCTETWEEREGRSKKGKKKNSKIKFYYCVTSYPKTKRPTSHSQNRFTNAPVAKMTLVGLRRRKEKGWFSFIPILWFPELWSRWIHLSDTDKEGKDDGPQPMRKGQNGSLTIVTSTKRSSISSLSYNTTCHIFPCTWFQKPCRAGSHQKSRVQHWARSTRHTAAWTLQYSGPDPGQVRGNIGIGWLEYTNFKTCTYWNITVRKSIIPSGIFLKKKKQLCLCDYIPV